MLSLGLLAYLLFIGGYVTGQSEMGSIEGFVGQSIILPCSCSEKATKVVWQKSLKVVAIYPLQDEMHTDRSYIDSSYMERTEINLDKMTGDCSLKLHNLDELDSGVFTCYTFKAPEGPVQSIEQNNLVNLTVSQHETPTKEPRIGEPGAVYIGVPVLVTVIILAGVLLLIRWIRGRHRTNTNIMGRPEVENPMMKSNV